MTKLIGFGRCLGKTTMAILESHATGHYIVCANRRIDKYIKVKGLKPYDYLFESNKRDKDGKKRPIGREQAWKILNKCAKTCGLKRIGTHSLRKSFGYHMYKKDQNVALLMEIFNHASPDITLRYIGINQDEKDKAMAGFSL